MEIMVSVRDLHLQTLLIASLIISIYTQAGPIHMYMED